jgi:serine/threonine-protein kinase
MTLAMGASADALSGLLADLQKTLGEGYAVERELGRGGMGTVYLARDLALDRLVAVKMLNPDLAMREDLRERFLRESRTTASFSHPHIVPVHAIIERPGVFGFVMGYIDGETLSARVRREGPMLPSDAVRMLREVAWGLAYAAGRGVVHRDVKPDNIIIERATGRAVITDFGIARTEAASGLTGVGQVVGTPHYMSPEQAAGEPVDARSDIYSLGAVAWFALAGSPPFEGETAGQIMAMHLTTPLPSLSERRPDLPAPLVELVERTLAKEPSDRVQSGEELVSALEPMAAQRTVPVVLRAAATRLRIVSMTIIAALTLGPLIAFRLVRRGASVDADIVLVFCLAISWGLLSNMWHGFRTIYGAGFRFDDLRDAILTLEEEGSELTRLVGVNPTLMTRLKRAERLAWVLLITGLSGISLAVMRMRELSGGTEALNRPGLITLIASTIMIGLALTTILTVPTRPTFIRRVVMRFWAGSGGRAIFTLFTRRKLPEPVTVPSGPTRASRRGVITVFESLSHEHRKALGDVPGQVKRLEQETETLSERIRQLQSTLNETGPSLPGDTPATPVEAARRRLRDDVEAALTEARERRNTIATSIEELRLELLRLKAGMGTSDAVREIVTRSVTPASQRSQSS